MIPLSLLLEPRQVWLCALMIRARKKSNYIQPGDEQSAVLYDYCMEHGLSRLVGTNWCEGTIRGSNHHRWLVHDALLYGNAGDTPWEMEPLMVQAVNRWIAGHLPWVMPKTGVFAHPNNTIDCSLDVHGPAAHSDTNKYALSWVTYNLKKASPRYRFYIMADLAGLLPPCPQMDPGLFNMPLDIYADDDEPDSYNEDTEY